MKKSPARAKKKRKPSGKRPAVEATPERQAKRSSQKLRAFYLPPEMSVRLDILKAVSLGRDGSDLVAEALELLFEKHKEVLP